MRSLGTPSDSKEDSSISDPDDLPYASSRLSVASDVSTSHAEYVSRPITEKLSVLIEVKTPLFRLGPPCSSDDYH